MNQINAAMKRPERRPDEGCFVLGFADIDRTPLAVVGGKGAQLGESCSGSKASPYRRGFA